MKLYVDNNNFIFCFLELENISSLKLIGQIEKVYPIRDNLVKVSTNDLQQITQDTSGLIEIFVLVDQNWQPIHLTEFAINFDNKAEIISQGTLYSCYIGGDNKLRITNEGFVSNKTLLKSLYLNQINSNQQEDLSLELTIITKHLMPHKFSLFIKNRKSQVETIVTTKDIQLISSTALEQTNGIVYTSKIYLTVKKKTFIDPIDKGYSTKELFFNWLDLYYTFEVKEFTSSKYPFRLATTLSSEPQDFFLKNKDQIYLLKASKNKNDYISFNYYRYNSAELDYFLDRTKYGINHIKKKSSKKTILVGEYPHTARDNGLAFFKYLMKHCRHEFYTYYIITADSPDFDSLAPFKDNVLIFGSNKHTDAFLEADYIVSSHSSFYLCPFSTNFALNTYYQKKCYFIQHGITLQKDVTHLYSFDENHFIDYFITSSDRESKLIESDYHFPKENILEFGMPRFDKLFGLKQRLKRTYSIGTNKTIFAFFTWRTYLNNLKNEDFVQTDYYIEIMKLLNDSFWEENPDLTLIIRLHPNLEKYSHLLSTKHSNVRISTESDSNNIQSYIINSDIMITDFSSAALDFSIMEKPTIYYVPLKERDDDFNNYLPYLPGDVVKNYSELMTTIKSYANKKKYTTTYIDKLNSIYKQRDNKASFRLVEHIKNNQKKTDS